MHALSKELQNSCGGTTQGKKSVGRHRHRREDNIKRYTAETGYKYVHWIKVAQDKVRTVGNILNDCKIGSCPKKTLYHGVSPLPPCMDLKVHHSVHKNPTLNPNLSHHNSDDIFIYHFSYDPF